MYSSILCDNAQLGIFTSRDVPIDCFEEDQFPSSYTRWYWVGRPVNFVKLFIMRTDTIGQTDAQARMPKLWVAFEAFPKLMPIASTNGTDTGPAATPLHKKRISLCSIEHTYVNGRTYPESQLAHRIVSSVAEESTNAIAYPGSNM